MDATMYATINDTEIIPEAPNLSGLSFRRFRGESDFPKMVNVLERSKAADEQEEMDTVESMARNYANLKNSDPYKDVIIVEMNGEVVGYKRVSWWAELDGTHIYSHFGFLVPEWRNKGIGRALFHHSEARLREIATEHPEGPRLFDAEVMDNITGLVSLIESEGYTPVRHWYEMVRPDLESLPEAALPEGIEVRPVLPEHLRQIWEAEVEAFKDHWGMDETQEGDYERWLAEPEFYFQPHHWQVAWEGDQVVGMVRNYINEEENAKFKRKRGWTEYISVRRPWRKRGVARALIARSFQMHKEKGMTEAALGVDTENPSGARQLYESMGFRTVKSGTSYRKPM